MNSGYTKARPAKFESVQGLIRLHYPEGYRPYRSAPELRRNDEKSSNEKELALLLHC